MDCKINTFKGIVSCAFKEIGIHFQKCIFNKVEALLKAAFIILYQTLLNAKQIRGYIVFFPRQRMKRYKYGIKGHSPTMNNMVLEFKAHEQNSKGLWISVGDGAEGTKHEIYSMPSC